MPNDPLPWDGRARALVPLVLALSACSMAPVHDDLPDRAVSPRRLAADLPVALPPPAFPSAAVAPAPGTAPGPALHADAKARIGLPPSPREAMAGVTPAAPRAETMAAPPAMARASVPASLPQAEPLPDGEVGAGIRAGQCWAQLAVEPRTVRRTAQVIAEDGAARMVLPHEGMSQRVWRRALCEFDAQPGVVSAVQAALRGRGLDVGGVDGRLGRKTMSALMTFQRQEGLAIGLLTYETLGQLGLGK